ncbi:unnamed protein product [Protopolystoma xenopodis]|uniref:Uncharacterized protein n=1 Tax=Protopolystoma xenopodis TaxID=117903 RepID=A0A3S5FE26_9PLAT|nr:unnamed protein product [Protopolystoma xenopodis]
MGPFVSPTRVSGSGSPVHQPDAGPNSPVLPYLSSFPNGLAFSQTAPGAPYHSSLHLQPHALHPLHTTPPTTPHHALLHASPGLPIGVTQPHTGQNFTQFTGQLETGSSFNSLASTAICSASVSPISSTVTQHNTLAPGLLATHTSQHQPNWPGHPAGQNLNAAAVAAANALQQGLTLPNLHSATQDLPVAATFMNWQHPPVQPQNGSLVPWFDLGRALGSTPAGMVGLPAPGCCGPSPSMAASRLPQPASAPGGLQPGMGLYAAQTPTGAISFPHSSAMAVAAAAAAAAVASAAMSQAHPHGSRPNHVLTRQRLRCPPVHQYHHRMSTSHGAAMVAPIPRSLDFPPISGYAYLTFPYQWSYLLLES